MLIELQMSDLMQENLQDLLFARVDISDVGQGRYGGGMLVI